MTDNESFLIRQLHSKQIGDDGAVIGQTVYSMDAFCEDIHFRRAWMTPTQIGRKAMLVNFSDAVAMNAVPRYALVTVALPRDFSREAIVELTHALEETAEEWGCEIIGGDTVGGEKLHLSITLISESKAPLMRTGICLGDLIAYTGKLGESRRELVQLEAGQSLPDDARFFQPTLRAEFIREARPLLRAGMDISDGLYCDTNKLLDLNEIGMDILENINIETGSSGEEYEMLIVFDREHVKTLKKLALSMDVPLNIFASVTQNTDRFPCKSHHFD